jgi:hypothetical protein
VNVPRRDLIRHPSSPIARWTRRILGVVATAVVLAVGVMIGSMVLAVTGDDDASAPAPAAAPQAPATSEKKRKARLRTRERRAATGARPRT